MTDNRQNPIAGRIEPHLQNSPGKQRTGWPRWMAEALAYKPESVVSGGTAADAPNASTGEHPQDLRVLSRVSSQR